MAEDKRIKVSVDYSELDQLRERVRSLTMEFNRLQQSNSLSPDQFQAYTDKFVDLQEQMLRHVSGSDNQFRAFDRAYQRFSDSYTGSNPNWRAGLTPPPSPISDRVADTGANRTIWDRVVGYLARITGNMEQEQRDRKNGDVPVGDTPSNKPQEIPTPPTPTQPPTSGGSDDGVERTLRNFRLPTNIGSILGMFAGGAILAQIGQMIGSQVQFSAQQYSMGDEFQRNINKGNNPLLNAMTFGITGAMASRRMHAYQMSRQMDESILRYNQMTGTGYNEGLAALYRMSGPLEKGSKLDKALWGEYEEPEVQQEEPEKKEFWASIASHNPYPQINGYSPGPAGVIGEAVDAKAQRGLGTEGLQNWASRTLGLNVGEYLDRYVNLSRAGLATVNDKSNINELMVAQRYRGLSDSDVENIQRATRYSTNRNGVEATSALDEQLQRYARNVLGYKDERDVQSYVSTMLPEMIQQFGRFSETALQTQGSFNAAQTLYQMSSIQNTTGAQGPRLERYQNAFSGMGISQDDVSQAILMRAARGLDPNASYSDIMEDIESVRSGQNMPLAKEFLKYIEDATGGEGEQFRNMLKTVFPNLSWADVNNYEKGKIDADTLFGSGDSIGERYSDRQAAQTVSAQEISAAETENRQAYDGHKEVQNQLGNNLEDIFDKSQVAKDILETMTLWADYQKENISKTLNELNTTVKAVARELNITLVHE